MFARLLPEDRKWELLKIVRLLQVFEAPLIWGGKTEDELTGNSDLNDINFHITDILKQAWEYAARIYGNEEDFNGDDTTGLIKKLLDEIRILCITHQSDMDERLKIAAAVLREQIFGQTTNEGPSSTGAWVFPTFPFNKNIINRPEKTLDFIPKHSRIVLFEAIRLSFDGRGLTESKKSLLQIAQLIYGIDIESFNELLAQAVALQNEKKRSINLVLE